MAYILLPSLLLCLFSCHTKSEYSFSDFLEVDKIQKVRMYNNSGTFDLSSKQLVQFKKDLGEMSFEPHLSEKLGSLSVHITIDNRDLILGSNSSSIHVEAHKSDFTKNTELLGDSPWVSFNTNGVNLNNYTPEEE